MARSFINLFWNKNIFENYFLICKSQEGHWQGTELNDAALSPMKKCTIWTELWFKRGHLINIAVKYANKRRTVGLDVQSLRSIEKNDVLNKMHNIVVTNRDNDLSLLT